jgi:hypothetical protein
MGTLIKKRLNQQNKFVEDDYFDDEDDNDGALIFENTQYINLLLFMLKIK